MIVFCVFGKHQYGNPKRGLGTEYSTFLPALEALGHRVVHFESHNKYLYRDFADLNKKLLESVIRQRPDVVLSLQMHYEVWLETWELVRRLGPRTVNWSADDNWRFPSFSRFVNQAFDCVTTTYPDKVDAYHREGVFNVLLTQWASGTKDLSAPIPASRCRHQVTFIGTAHGYRRHAIRKLREMGVPVRCFGHGWESGPVAMGDIPGIVRQSVISLNFANSPSGKQIKARNFEVPGFGGFLLTEHVDGLERYYEIGRQIDTFVDLRECRDKILHYLARPEKRDAMALEANRRTAREHTYVHRMEALLRFVTECVPEKRGEPPERILSEFQKAAVRYHRFFPAARIGGWLVTLPLAILKGWGRGSEIARWLCFQASWRVLGPQTYSCRSVPGRMFPHL